MSHFIDRIAQHIYDEQLELEHLTIVLPSQRAKKYLQRALFKVYGKPIFSPKIITMNRWVQELSSLPIIEPTRALRSEEHTSELQSRPHLVCRLLLEKKKHRRGIAASD